MKLGWIGNLALLAMLGLLLESVQAQGFRGRGGYGRGGGGNGPDDSDQGGYREPERVKLPSDPKLLEIHRQFVTDAEKLASDYKKAGQLDKARACYEEIIRLVPTYEKGRDELAEVKTMQATAEKKNMTVMANGDWQDSGVIVVEGKPIIITASGLWNFHIAADLEADGMEIPREMRDFNLGALVGMIDDNNPKNAKPFFVGSRLEYTPEHSGRLLLRMYDADVTDNTGKLDVVITGLFASGGKRQALGGNNSSAP